MQFQFPSFKFQVSSCKSQVSSFTFHVSRFGLLQACVAPPPLFRVCCSQGVVFFFSTFGSLLHFRFATLVISYLQHFATVCISLQRWQLQIPAFCIFCNVLQRCWSHLLTVCIFFATFATLQFRLSTACNCLQLLATSDSADSTFRVQGSKDTDMSNTLHCVKILGFVC